MLRDPQLKAPLLRFEQYFLNRLNVRKCQTTPGRIPRVSGFNCWTRFDPADPPKAKVLLFHGAGNDRFFPQVQLIEALIEARVQVVAIDLDGHGRDGTSQLVASELFSLGKQSVDEFYEPALPLYLVGFSIGGLVAIAGAGDCPSVAGVGVIAAPLSLPGRWSWAVGELGFVFDKRYFSSLPVYPWLDMVPAIGRLKRRQYPVRIGSMTGFESAAYLEQVYQILKTFHEVSPTKKISCPGLLCYGGRDSIGSAYAGQALANQNPNLSLKIYPRDTHFTVMMDHEVFQDLIELTRNA